MKSGDEIKLPCRLMTCSSLQLLLLVLIASSCWCFSVYCNEIAPVARLDNDEISNAQWRLGVLVGLSPTAQDTGREQTNSVKARQSILKFPPVDPFRYPYESESLLEAIRDEILKSKTQTSVDTDDRECILGRAHHYLAHWLNKNGTINTENYEIWRKHLDLSNHVYPSINRFFKQFLKGGDKLIYLSLANSGINVIPKDELTHVNGTLGYLSLMGNALTASFDLPILGQLLVLDLRKCGLLTLPKDAFVGTPKLTKLFLAHNGILRLRSYHFTGLTLLRHLDLSYITQTRIAGLSGYEQQDPYNSLTEGLDLHEFVFEPLANLTFLDMSHTKLLSYSARAFRHITVKQLSLCYTGIPIIVSSMIHGTLQVLDISGNPGIASSIHHDKGDARSLNLNLEILVCENSTVKRMDWISGMINLRVLMLSTNNINQLTNSTFANMPRLEILDLSNNHISNWHQRVLESNPEVYILDLSENNINVLTTEMLYDLASVQFLAIGHNSFVCHCLLREFIELAAKNAQSIACLLNNIVNHLPDSSTATPESEEVGDMGLMQETTISNIPLEVDTQQSPTTPVTNSNELQTHTNEYDVLFRVVHSYVSTIYNSTENFQSSIEKYGRNRPPLRVYRKIVDGRVNTLFRGDGCINDTDSSPPTVRLDVPDFIEPLYGLHFQIIDFDEDRYKCIDLDDAEFYLFEQERCFLDRSLLPNFVSYSNTTATIIKFTLMFFGFALVAFIIYISKWDHVKYFCIIVRNATILSMMKRKKDDLLSSRKESLKSVVSNYAYDVFVSYSEQDRQWVLDELLPNMEKTEDINVCLHERDFKVGVSILENIIYSMDKSRTLLLVMSEAFLLSHWCQFEMHLAQHRLLETQREQLILVLLEDIPKSKRPKTLQYLMKTNTYIIWPHVAEPEKEPQPEKGVSDEKKKRKKHKKDASRRQKDAQALAEEQRLFWKRLRKAITGGVVWEPDIGGGGDR